MGEVGSYKVLHSSANKGLQVTATHSARNAGASRYREMFIETK